MLAVTGGENVTLTMELRHLPSWVKSELSKILELQRGWREVMGRIPAQPWVPGQPLPTDQHYIKRYLPSDIFLVEDECNKRGRCGFEVLLEEWGTSGRIRATLNDLLNILDQAKLYRAMDYITVHVLKGEAPARDDENLEDLNNSLPSESTQDCLWIEVDQELTLQQGDPPRLTETYSSQAYAPMLNHQETTVMGAVQPTQSEKMVEKTVSDFPAIEIEHSNSLTHFPYYVLKEAANSFPDLSIDYGGTRLGEGAFGTVYKAKIIINDAVQTVAVKRLNMGEMRVDQQFKMEIDVLSRCIHENVVRLEGYSCDGPQWCLLYAFMANGSLQDRLACLGGSKPLNWETRLSITSGTAEGIAYLHTYQQQPLVHRDIKSANILLDEHFVPKVGDFGLVKLGGGGTHTRTLVKTTTVFGTSAYMAPEAFRGDVSVKMDTFSYGIVMFELLTGLPPYDEHREGCDLLSYILETESENEELIDKTFGTAVDMGLALQLFELAEKCTADKRKRPTMVQVVQSLKKLIA
ncbi:interleukin-1 receptor-associated kinase 4-like isoform X2 [Oratosquilla oratoria]